MPEENVGGGSPTGGGQPDAGAGSGQAGQQTQNAPGGGQQPVAGAGGGQQGGQQGAGEKSYTYKEDRTDWVPRTRLNEQKADYEKRFKELQGKIDDTTNRVRQAFGVETPSEQDQEAAAVKTAILKLFPGLEHLGSLSKEQLDEVLDSARSARQTSVSSWERHATTMINDAIEQVAGAYGVEKLTDRQVTRVKREYREAATACAYAREVAVANRDSNYDFDHDFLARHERGDKALIKEFVKEFLDDFYEPARRSESARLQRRNRPLPGGERTRTQVATTVPEIDFTDEAAFKKALGEARAQR